MSTLPCEPPGMTDLLKLGALVPTTKLRAPKVSHVLEEVLELCRIDWISDFLFTEDPIHMNHLTSSNLFNTSFVSELLTTRVEPLTSQPDPYSIYGESHQLHHRFLIVPTFTVGNITIGIGVMALTAGLLFSPGNLSQDPPKYCNIRFVRDASRRQLLVVLDMPKEDCICIYCAEHKLSTFCQVSIVQLCRTALLSSIRTSKANFIEKAISSLRCVTEESYYRQCPVCGTHHGANCGCSLSNLPPAHPYDFRSFTTALSENFGTFEGLASKFSGLLSGAETTLSFGARVSSRIINDSALKQRLRAWSICEHLNTQGEDPRQSLAQTLGDVNNIARSSAPLETEVVMENRFSKTPFCNNQFGNVTGANSGNFRSTTDIFGGPQTTNGKNMHSSFTSVTPCVDPPDWSDVVKETAPADLSIGRQGGNLDEWWYECSPAAFPKRDTRAAQPRIYAGVCDSGRLLASVLAKTPANTRISPTVLQRPSTTLKEDDAVEVERRRKLEERKEKNRAAARRCNKKNTELQVAVRRDLKILNDKVEVLRKCESQLRHENLVLRKLLAEQKRLTNTSSIGNQTVQ